MELLEERGMKGKEWKGKGYGRRSDLRQEAEVEGLREERELERKKE